MRFGGEVQYHLLGLAIYLEKTGKFWEQRPISSDLKYN